MVEVLDPHEQLMRNIFGVAAEFLGLELSGNIKADKEMFCRTLV